MRFLLVPTRFPSPESMGQGDVTMWTNWIREETDVIMNQLDEELIARGDPDNPFNGSANGVFQPLRENFSLPPPVQTPRRQTNKSKHSDSLWKSLEEHNKWGGTKGSKESQTDVKTQGAVRETGKHSTNSLNPSRNTALQTQRQQQHSRNEVNTSPANAI